MFWKWSQPLQNHLNQAKPSAFHHDRNRLVQNPRGRILRGMNAGGEWGGAREEREAAVMVVVALEKKPVHFIPI